MKPTTTETLTSGSPAPAPATAAHKAPSARAPESVPAALETSNLTVNLSGRRVLEAVNLKVEHGEQVCLLGPNGAGKTTLLRSILGLVRIHSGSVEIEGVRKTGQGALRHVGYVPQRHEFAWSYPITVHDAVLSGRVDRRSWFRLPNKADLRATRKAIGRVQMEDLSSRPISELSGGQRQRVLIARALATNPHVLLLDEPFTGLDLPTQETLTNLFADLADEGEGLLMTTHDVATALEFSDRAYLLNRRIVAAGAPAELCDEKHWTQAFGVSQSSPMLAVIDAILNAKRTAC